MGNILALKWEIWVLIFLHIDYLGPTVQTVFLFERFSFSFSVYNSLRRERLFTKSQSTSGGEVGHRDQRGLPCWFLNAAALCFFSFLFFIVQ